MTHRHPPAIGIALAAMLFATCAAADTLELDNGDRLSGTVKSMQDGKLVFVTDFDQELSVPWTRVRQISTDNPVRLVLADETHVGGRISSAQPGRARLQESAALEEADFALASVTAINPPEGPGVVPVRTEGRATLGASQSSGNTRTQSLHAAAEFVARTTRNRYTLGGESHYGKDQGVRNRNETLAYARYDHFVHERWYLNSNVSAARDEFRDLDLRTSFGVGLGYQVQDTPQQRLSVEGGINYIHESFREGGSDSRPAARVALDYERRFRRGFELFHRNETLVGLDDIDDVLFRSRTGLRFPLMARVEGTLQFNYDFDNLPPPGNRRADTATLLTLGYSW